MIKELFVVVFMITGTANEPTYVYSCPMPKESAITVFQQQKQRTPELALQQNYYDFNSTANVITTGFVPYDPAKHYNEKCEHNADRS